ncbi:MAG: class I SAM-dependent methyltransferase [Candidatus Pacearchaeota archaeon]|jgi:ubiquinone/menaquinone biosynthesis C-methylase UbiE
MAKNLISKNEKFFDFISQYYNSFSGGNSLKIYNKMIKVLDIKDKSKVLDAGCGTGNLLYFLYKRNRNISLYGIDVSSKMLSFAREKFDRAKVTIELKKESVENISFNAGFFDFVFSVDAFHHYSNPFAAFKKFYYVLKKGGKLAIIDFDFGMIGNKIFHYLEPGNKKGYSKKEIYNFYVENGFGNIKQYKLGWFSWLTIGTKLK